MNAITINALRVFPNQLEAYYAAVPAAFKHWRPESWEGIPSERLTFIEQICHLRDIEVEGYHIRLHRTLHETHPTLVSIDTDALAKDRSYHAADAAQVLADFRLARQKTVALIQGILPEQMNRTAVFEGYGLVTVRGLIHFLCSHDQQHLAGLQWLMGQISALPESKAHPLGENSRHRLSLDNIARSASVIPPEFLNSPHYNCEPLSAALGCQLTIKLDFTNPIRSFKGRGASFLVSEMQRRGDQRAIVCASAGNWGQAMAYACRSFGLPIVIYAAVNANPLKVARMKALGAQVRQEGHDFDAAKDAAKAYAAHINGWMVEDGFDPEISEGHGTVAIELLSRGDAFDAIAIPLGNGAMLNGMARWFKAASPATRVLGVCAANAPSMAQSWRQHSIIETPTADTMADGIAVRVPIPEAVHDMQGLVDDVLLIDEAHITQAMRLVYQHAGLLLEPAGAVGVAAIVAHRAQFAGKRVATVLCGSNVQPEFFQSIL